MSAQSRPETVAFVDGVLVLIDQTRLPEQTVTLECHSVEQAHDAISRLVVRGAPAIGIAAAYAVCLAKPADHQGYLRAIDYLATSRPTAVNLFWALQRMKEVLERTPASEELAVALLAEARAIEQEDREMGREIGRHGAAVLGGCQRVLTHCNAGGLATAKWGTALAPIYHLHQAGHPIEVFADETRPLWQGARLTAWELCQAGIPVTVLTDSMSGSLFRSGAVDAVIVGADRIAANGDVANKIGTYPLAVLAHYHQVPFYVAAPSSTFDLSLASGEGIPIEQRARQEVACPGGMLLVPDAAQVINPAFDVTPAQLITAIITERGLIESPGTEKIASHLAPR